MPVCEVSAGEEVMICFRHSGWVRHVTTASGEDQRPAVPDARYRNARSGAARIHTVLCMEAEAQAGIVWSLPLIIASGVKMPQGTGAGGAAGRKWDR